MPTPYVKQLASKHGVTVGSSEAKWKQAKKLAADQGHAEDYDYVTGIFKSLMKEDVEQDLSQFIHQVQSDDAGATDTFNRIMLSKIDAKLHQMQMDIGSNLITQTGK